MQFFDNAFQLNYWLTLDQLALSTLGTQVLGGVFFGLVAAGILLRITPNIIKGKDLFFYRMLAKYSTCFTSIGVSGLLFVYFAKKGAYILGARFWLLVIFGVLLLWVGKIFHYIVRVIPQRRKKITEEQYKKRYL